MRKVNSSEQRQSFTFYLSFEEAIRELDDNEQLILYKSISQYSLFGKEPSNLTGLAKLVWKLLFPVLSKSRTKYLNGLKGGAPEGNKNNRFSESTTKVQPNNNQRYNTDTETEADTETETKNSSIPNGLECKMSDDIMPASRLFLDKKEYTRVQGMWNDTCKGYRQVTKLTSRNTRSNRKGKIYACLNMLYEVAGTKEGAFERLQNAFDKVAKSKFLSGENERGWKADFDWVMNASNLEKIIEGNYDNPVNDYNVNTLSVILGENCVR